MAETHFSGRLSGYELTPGYQSGIYYSCPVSALNVNAPPYATMRCLPFFCVQDNYFDQIAFELQTMGNGETGGNLWQTRLGIYGTDMNEAVGNLILDAGVVATGTGSAVGAKSIAISLFLMTGLYWLAWVTQGSGGTLPTGAFPYPRCSNVLDVVALPEIAGINATCGLEMTGITGALPLIAPYPQLLSNPVPRIFLRSA
jgi:hypothetical protein